MARVRAGKLLRWIGVGAVGLGALAIMGLLFTRWRLQAVVVTVPVDTASHRRLLFFY